MSANEMRLSPMLRPVSAGDGAGTSGAAVHTVGVGATGRGLGARVRGGGGPMLGVVTGRVTGLSSGVAMTVVSAVAVVATEAESLF